MNRGILLMNLGSPDSTAVPDVKKYLTEFLMDGRVIDKPYLFRKLLVQGLIVPFRASRSAEAYSSIWTKDGSPLIVLSKQLQDALKTEIDEPVALAMRYGHPSVDEGFRELMRMNPSLEEVIAIPLYPHYAMSSYETAVEHAKSVHSKQGYSFNLKFIRPFYDEPSYLNALKESIKPYLSEPFDQILFSYHGIPERHVQKTDRTGSHCLKVADCCNVSSEAHKQCYRHQCLVTTELVASQLGIPKNKYAFSFQSRLGRSEWLKPYTAIRLEQLPAEGIKRLLIVCPAFISDCLETLEEIAIEGRESFLEAGGESFTMIPCLNLHPLWIQSLSKWIREYAQGNERMILA
jgi:protoporphyrin/coproporphyrin ferrochelatase